MAKILADKDIHKLIGSVLMNADEELLNPNGIELRLGKNVLFHSTGEEKELKQGNFLKVSPGENVVISSIESIDFNAQAVQSVFPECMMMAFLTPTTTMMREGISQVATKIDSGYRGILNWSLRNGSINDLILQYEEPIFKMTFFLLDKNESPEVSYGDRPGDSYQDTDGIKRSKRRIPVDIPESKIVSSKFGKLDPKKQLRDAGYPFDHIATELITLDDRIQIVSSDVRLMKDEFHSRISEVTDKIKAETSTLSGKIEETQKTILDKIDLIFEQKFYRIAGAAVGTIIILFSGINYLYDVTSNVKLVAFIATVVGIFIIFITYILNRKL